MGKRNVIKLFWFLFIFIAVFLPGYSKFQQLVENNRQLEEKIRQLEISNSRFKKEINRLEQEPAYVEKIARDKLKVSKKGEIIYKMKDSEEAGKR